MGRSLFPPTRQIALAIGFAVIAILILPVEDASAAQRWHVYPNKSHVITVTAKRARHVTKRTLHHDWSIRGGILAPCDRQGHRRGGCDFLFGGTNGDSYCGHSWVKATRRHVRIHYIIARNRCGEF